MHKENGIYVCIIYGDPGSGKSYGGLSLCEGFDPNFNKANCVFSIEQFFELLVEGKLEPGSAILFEELGVAAGAREWNSMKNIALSKVAQVMRTKNVIVFYTLPRLQMGDKHISMLATALIEMKGIDRERNLGRGVLFDPAHYDPKTSEWKKTKPRFCIKNASGHYAAIAVRDIRLRQPSRETLKFYDKAREEFTNKTAKDGLDILRRTLEEETKIDKRAIPQEKIEEMASQVVLGRLDEKFATNDQLDMGKIKAELGCSAQTARDVKAAARRMAEKLKIHLNWRGERKSLYG